MDEAATATYLAGHREFAVAFPPARMLDLRAIAGGKDNLPRIEIRSGNPPYGFAPKRAARLLADGASLDTLRTTDAWRLTRRETQWISVGWEAAVARREALRLRHDISVVRSGGSSSVARLMPRLTHPEAA